MTQNKLNNLSIRLEKAYRNIVSSSPNNVSPKVNQRFSHPSGYFCVQRNEFINFKFSSSSYSKKIDYDYDNEY